MKCNVKLSRVIPENAIPRRVTVAVPTSVVINSIAILPMKKPVRLSRPEKR